MYRENKEKIFGFHLKISYGCLVASNGRINKKREGGFWVVSAWGGGDEMMLRDF